MRRPDPPASWMFVPERDRAKARGESLPPNSDHALTPCAVGALYGFPLPRLEEVQDALDTGRGAVNWVAPRLAATKENRDDQQQ